MIDANTRYGPIHFGLNPNMPIFAESILNDNNGWNTYDLVIKDTNGAELVRLFLSEDGSYMVKLDNSITVMSIVDEE